MITPDATQLSNLGNAQIHVNITNRYVKLGTNLNALAGNITVKGVRTVAIRPWHARHKYM